MNFKNNFENDEISLIQAKRDDFDNLYSIASDNEIWEQHPENDRWRKNKFSIFFDNGISNEFGMLIIYLKPKNEIIGSTRFYLSTKDSIKIGYTYLSPEYWGTGANKEIKKAMLDYAFEFVDKVYFDISKKNIRSRTAVEKLGAVLSDKTDEKVFYRIDKERYFGA